METTDIPTIMTQSSSRVALLESALNDLQIRSAVEETMQSMLIDVELAETLNKQVSHQTTVSQLEANLNQSSNAFEEQRALQHEDSEKRVSLADDFVKELWLLSMTLGDLEEWKREALPKVEEHDSLVARLMQAEEEIRVLKEEQQKQPEAPASSSSPPPAQLEEQQQEQPTVVVDAPPPDAAEAAAQVPLPRDDVEVDNVTITQDAVVALLEEEEPPNLAELDMKILNHIFAYLDAFEILRTAQCNISLYSRVDSLFGLGAGDVVEEVEEAPVVQQPQPGPETSISNRVTDPGTAPVSMSSVAPQQKTQPVTASPPRLLGGIGGGGPGRQGGLFAMLQNRGQARNAPVVPATVPSMEQPALNRNAVNSMADKLTPTELTAIISMTEKLHSREKQVQALEQEKEQLAGRLEGTERFKNFLSQKVLDLEKSLRQNQEDQTKVTLQIASDQEVIAFLDGRVQELERHERVLTEEKKKLVQELERVNNQNAQKTRVLSDMLQFERERLLENEKDWKATKKLLVKEVKNCRAQIVAAQAERDGYREQNDRLKKAVLVNGGSREKMDLL